MELSDEDLLVALIATTLFEEHCQVLSMELKHYRVRTLLWAVASCPEETRRNAGSISPPLRGQSSLVSSPTST